MTKVLRKGFRDKNGKQVVIVPNVPGATSGNLASLDAEGNLQDSGKKASDFAPVIHNHDDVIYQDSDGFARVYATSSEEDGGEVHIIVKKGNGNYKSAIIDDANINNLIRALATPSSIPENDATKLITSKAVYDALLNAGGIASVNLHATVVKDNSSYTYFGVKYGSSTEEENWPDGDPEGMYMELRRALGETGNTVIPFELTVKNGSDVVQAVVLGLVHYTKTSETGPQETHYYHEYRFSIGMFGYVLIIHEVDSTWEYISGAFTTRDYSSNL